MAIYQLTPDCPVTGKKADVIKLKGVDGGPPTFIPMSPDNAQYQEYLEWAKTNTADPV